MYRTWLKSKLLPRACQINLKSIVIILLLWPASIFLKEFWLILLDKNSIFRPFFWFHSYSFYSNSAYLLTIMICCYCYLSSTLLVCIINNEIMMMLINWFDSPSETNNPQKLLVRYGNCFVGSARADRNLLLLRVSHI